MKNTATKTESLPPLVEDMLYDRRSLVDNVFADAWKELGFGTLITRCGFYKRSGTDIVTIVYLLLVWRWMYVNSIAKFSEKSILLFEQVHRDALYDTLKREDINWRDFNLQVARKVHDRHKLALSRTRTFVLDDSIKTRRGKKMEAVSGHFDHTTNTQVMGQQVLTLGLATEDSFLPLDSQIFISNKKAQPLREAYQDGRSVAAKRYVEATEQTKVEMAMGMLRRASRAGLRADYLVADAWFGNKSMMRQALSLDLTAILRMKKNKLKYRVKLSGRWHEMDAKTLYQHVARKQWVKVRNLPWKVVELKVQVDLSTLKGKGAKPDYHTVKLLFVRGAHVELDTDGGAKSWALFLSTDETLSSAKMLETYALRWGIEVYFKEAKQHLGFLQEQTISFTSHTASIHLCAIRYLILMSGKLDCPTATVGSVRDEIQEQLNSLCFATQLWQYFRAIVRGTLKSIARNLGCTVKEIMGAIDGAVQSFLVRSLQLDAITLAIEHE